MSYEYGIELLDVIVNIKTVSKVTHNPSLGNSTDPRI